MAAQVRTATDGAIGWIVFDHLERRNAITAEMWRQIPAAARALAEDPAVRVLVMRGEGEEAFVAGADISEFENLRRSESAQAYEAENARAFAALANLQKPLLAMIHGFCVGGGVALSLCADMRYAASDAIFAIPAARLGLGYSMMGIEALVGLVGPATAKEILFTARRLNAEQALQKGLVTAVVAKTELEAFVRQVAAEIASNAPLTIRSVKGIVAELARDPAARDLEAIADSIRACFASEDYREGVSAFLEKRRPNFRGR